MSVTFTLLTDTHLWPTAPADFGAPKMLTAGEAIHEAAIPAVNALSPDFVLHGGDLLCGGSSFDLASAEYDRSLADAVDFFGRFDAPFYCVPGNHDCDAQTWSFDAFHDAFGTSAPLMIDGVAPGIRLARANVFLGDTREYGAGQWTDEHDEALRDADRSALADGASLILCLHTWLLPDEDPAPGADGRGCVAGADRLLATVSECPSIAVVLTGHRHLNRITAYRDFLVVDTAALIGYPFGFREITISDDGWLSTCFHTLDLPDVAARYFEREDRGEPTHWAGQPHDRNIDILVPRLRS